MPPSPSQEDVSGGGSTVRETKPAYGGMLAVYAERAKPSDKPVITAPSEVVDAMAAAVTPDDDWAGSPVLSADDTVEISAKSVPPSDSFPPNELPSGVVCLDEIEETEAQADSPEGKEYSRSVDDTGIKDQFLNAGGQRSEIPPPPTETNTGTSGDEDLRQDILNKLKLDLSIVLPNSTPAKLLQKVNGVIFGDFWPSTEQDARRVISLLFDALAVQEYSNKDKLSKTPLEDLKALLKAELDLRRAKKSEIAPSGAVPLSNPHKKRKGPPPIPR